MKILITGVAGLLGSRLAEYLLANKPGVEVIGIDDLSGGYVENVPKGVIFYRYDVGNAPNLDRVFDSHKFDVVYHFAAYAAECVSPFIRQYNYTNNLLNTANIVNLCIKHNVKRLVFTSSMSVYGRGNPPFSETDVRQPIDPYGIAKLACEMDIEVAHEQHGLEYCILVPHNVYGRNQNIHDNYRNVLGIWMRRTLENKPMLIYGDGLQERAFSCIDDILEPMWTAATSEQAKNQRINLGGIHHTTIKDAAYTLQSVMGGGEIIHMPPRHEAKYAYSTHEKSVELLGFKHTTDLHTGLTDMWQWAQQQPMRKQFVWENYELENGLYEYWKPEFLKS